MNDIGDVRRININNYPVVFVKNLVGDIFLLRVHCPSLASKVLPGQFLNIKVNKEYIPLLRKPFSVCQCDKKEGWIEILWKIVGKGTEILSNYKTGDEVNILGPLGRGFSIQPDLKRAALIGGGLGIAPLPFLCRELLNLDVAVDVYLGAKKADELSFVNELLAMGVEVFVTTEDGSEGKTGLVTDVLVEQLREKPHKKPDCLFSCGPSGFLNRMIEITTEFDIEGQISIETMMGCGFGICMGCPVKITPNRRGNVLYKLACIDGPVFNAREILLDG